MLRLIAIALVMAAAVLKMVPSAPAGEADVVTAEASRQSDGNWRFIVTLRHADAGWEHYADR